MLSEAMSKRRVAKERRDEIETILQQMQDLVGEGREVMAEAVRGEP